VAADEPPEPPEVAPPPEPPAEAPPVLDLPPVPLLPEPPDPHAEASKPPAKMKAETSLFFMILLF